MDPWREVAVPLSASSRHPRWSSFMNQLQPQLTWSPDTPQHKAFAQAHHISFNLIWDNLNPQTSPKSLWNRPLHAQHATCPLLLIAGAHAVVGRFLVRSHIFVSESVCDY